MSHEPLLEAELAGQKFPAAALAQLVFPLAGRTSVVLPGLDDLRVLRKVLGAIDSAQPDPAVRGLALTGAGDPAARPGWSIGWAGTAGWEAVGALADRRIDLP